MKYFLSILILVPYLIFAQDENEDQSIELPDFVITGVQNISIPVMKKEEPKLIPTLSDEFFMPTLISGELALTDSSEIIRREVNLYGNLNSNNGLLSLGAGTVTLPTGDLFLNQSMKNFLFRSHVWGSNTKEYVDNAGYNISGLSASTDFYINNTSSFLPGLNISLSGFFYRDLYKFYGSDTPELKRETNKSKGRLALINNLSEYFKYGLSASAEFLNIKESGLRDDLYSAEMYADVNLNSFGFGFDGSYVLQQFKFNSIESENNYYTGNLYFSFNPSNNFDFKLGAHYSAAESEKLFSPFAGVSLKLGDYLSLFGEYHPKSKFVTYNNFIVSNKFVLENNVQNVFTEYKSNSKIILRYQFDKYYEIDFGVGYADVNNLVYFQDADSKGKFDVNTIRDITNLTAYLHVMFHKGPMGFFYGSAEYNYLQLNNGSKVPHYPVYSSSIIYGYDFDMGITIKTKLELLMETYADIENKIKIPSFADWSLYLYYKLFDDLNLTLSLENLMNRENFIYNGYQEKTLDIIGGVEYRW